ncbi:hypothetical protein BDW66DRAFT_134182 [Aspergillus desertorum]
MIQAVKRGFKKIRYSIEQFRARSVRVLEAVENILLFLTVLSILHRSHDGLKSHDITQRSDKQ